MDAEIVGISTNVTFSQRAFADFLKLNFPLLSDAPDGKTMQEYGVYNPERKLAVRSYFIVDKQGIIRYARMLKRGEALLSNEELLAELQKLK